MFITKKKFDEAIRKAKEEKEYEMWKREEDERKIRYIHERIDELEKTVFKLHGKNANAHCECVPLP